MRFDVATDVALFAESVAGALAGWEPPREPALGSWWDERDERLEVALAELGWAELWSDPELLAMVVAGAIELGRACAPLSLVDEATLGAPLGLGGRVRHGDGRSRCAVPSVDGLAACSVAGGRREPTLDGVGTILVELGRGELYTDGHPRLQAWGAATLGYLAGLAAGAVATAVSHVGAREQFGASLGALPAVQGRLAESALARDGLELVAWGAAHPGSAVFPADALTWAGAACQEVTAQVVQVHGGIGFSLEGGVHRQYRRAKTVQVWTDAVVAALADADDCG
ncbi:MAG: acyl-CoA dehydrogenase family protein [Gaiellales bacterium]